jgi:hypothetical protein
MRRNNGVTSQGKYYASTGVSIAALKGSSTGRSLNGKFPPINSSEPLRQPVLHRGNVKRRTETRASGMRNKSKRLQDEENLTVVIPLLLASKK